MLNYKMKIQLNFKNLSRRRAVVAVFRVQTRTDFHAYFRCLYLIARVCRANVCHCAVKFASSYAYGTSYIYLYNHQNVASGGCLFVGIFFKKLKYRYRWDGLVCKKLPISNIADP